jgi:hypothetical protein
MPVMGRVSCFVSAIDDFLKNLTGVMPVRFVKLQSDQTFGGIVDLGQQRLDLLFAAGASKVISTFLVASSAFTDWTPCNSPTSVSMVWVQCPQEMAGTE